MKKKLIFLLTLAMSASFSLGLAACGGEESSSSDSSSSQTTSSPDSSSSSGKRTYTLSFATSGSAVESVTVEEGETVELSQYASTKTGAEFVGWIYGGYELLSEITLERDMELTAVFTGDVINAGNNVYLGKYPQQRVTDETLLSKLNAEASRNQNPARVTYEGKEYLREGAPYKGVFADGTEMSGYYYFELQPLLWTRVSGNPNESVSTWTTRQVIDATTYYDGSNEAFSRYYETDYCEFAHDDFLYETDYFSQADRDLMVYTETDDFKYSVVYVTALSSWEGYVGYTDYAATQEVSKYKNGNVYSAVYWLYNTDADYGEKLKVSSGGSWNGKADCDEIMGFRPVIKLDLRPSTVLTFETNGGEAMDEKAYKVGDALPVATRTGYTLAGWYSDANLTQAVSSVPAQATKLYAKWTPTPYNITYELNAYDTSDALAADNHADNPTTYTVEDDVALKAPTAKAGTVYQYYTFGGWYKDELLMQKIENVSELGGDTQTLYAKWTMTDYTITYVLDGGTNHADNPATINYVSERITLKDPTKAEHDFEGWYLDAGFTRKISWLEPGQHPFYTTNYVGEVTLYALFEEIYERTEGDVTYRIKDDVVTVVALADPTKTSVVIPATVEGKAVNAIAESTFANASAVTDVTFECAGTVINSLTSAHFAGLTNLENVGATTSAVIQIVKQLPDKTLKSWTVTDATFGGCTISGYTIEKIVLGDKVERISDGAFNQLVGVKEMYIGKDVVMSANNAYLTTYNASSELAFETLTVPTTAFLSKFYQSSHYASVKNFTILGGAFSGAPTNVEKITLGADVTAGGYSFLASRANLEEIEIDSANAVFSFVGGALVENGNKLVYLMSGTIPSAVTEIAAYAAVAQTVTELVIPEGVTKIGASAFSGNTALVKVSLPASLTSLDKTAFSSSVKTLDVACGLDFYGSELRKGVQTLTVTAKSVDSFSGWYELVTANLVGVETIDSSAFDGCTSLETVNMPALKTGAKHVFTRCQNLKTVTLGESLTAIPEYMFSYDRGSSYPNYLLKSLENINLDYVQTIGNNAFRNCEKLNVTLGNNVQSIGYDAFYGCAITGDLNLPASLTSIGSGAFSGNTGITAIKYAGTLAQWEAITNNGFITYAVDYYCGGEKITDYSPSGDVVNNVFAYSKSLESVDLTSAKAIGNNAFKGCVNLEEITGVSALETIGEYAFYECAKLSTATVTSMTNVKTIGRYAFSGCTGITGALEFNEGLTNFGRYAFSGCAGITKVVIPSTVTFIGSYCFQNTGIVEVVMNTNSMSGNSGEYDADWYVGLQAETVTVKVQPNSSGTNIRLENHYYGLLAKVKTLRLTGAPTNGELMMAVQDMTKLETLILDEGITAIGMSSLTNLTSLKTLVVKANVSSFPCNKSGSFRNMTSLENLYANDAVYTGITTQANGGMTVTNHYSVAEWTGM